MTIKLGGVPPPKWSGNSKQPDSRLEWQEKSNPDEVVTNAHRMLSYDARSR